MGILGIVIDFDTSLLFILMIYIIFFVYKFLMKKKNFKLENYKKDFFKKQLIYLITSIYFAFIIGVTLLPIMIGMKNGQNVIPINLNPFYIFSSGNFTSIIVNILGNIFLLFPLPILLFLGGNNKIINNYSYTIKISVIVSLSIELLQLLENYAQISFIPRTTDTTDLLTNVLGAILGTLFISIFIKIYKKENILHKELEIK